MRAAQCHDSGPHGSGSSMHGSSQLWPWRRASTCRCVRSRNSCAPANFEVLRREACHRSRWAPALGPNGSPQAHAARRLNSDVACSDFAWMYLRGDIASQSAQSPSNSDASTSRIVSPAPSATSVATRAAPRAAFPVACATTTTSTDAVACATWLAASKATCPAT
jgi:hypothetical protein